MTRTVGRTVGRTMQTYNTYRQARAVFEEDDYKFEVVAKLIDKKEIGKQITNVDAVLPSNAFLFEVMLYTTVDPLLTRAVYYYRTKDLEKKKRNK